MSQKELEGRVPLSVAQVVSQEIGSIDRRKPTWSYSVGGLLISVWRSRYFAEEDDFFCRRSIYFQVFSNDDLTASGHFVEWRCKSIGFLDEFFWAADAISQADCDTALLLQAKWNDDFPPFDYGNVVRFERLVIRSSGRSHIVWTLIDKLIVREFSKRGCLMLLKAFPLEFEGRCGNEAPKEIKRRFRKRLAAMRRYYTRVLDVAPVSGSFGKEGWMWRPLRYCPPLK